MTNGYDGLDDERDGRVFDLHPAGPGGDLPWRVRRAQVIQTLTESAGDPYGYGSGHRRHSGLTDDAKPGRNRLFTINRVAATSVPVRRHNATANPASSTGVVCTLLRAAIAHTAG